MSIIVQPELYELSAVIKTICDRYKIPSDEIRAISMEDGSLGQHKDVVLKRRIPVNYPLPSELQTDGDRRASTSSCSKLTLHTIRGVREANNSTVITKLESQLGEFEIKVRGKAVRFWMWHGTFGNYYPVGLSRAVFAEAKDIFALLRASKTWEKEQLSQIEPPVLPTEMLTEIYDNSIGFLLSGNTHEKEYQRFHIPFKRGLLFCGRAGCGKTLTCKWLRDLCRYHKLAYRTISMGVYRRAASMGDVSALFRLEGRKKGIIFFDDMDIMVRDRNASATVEELSIFLSELDGLDVKKGIVYIFTTNYIKELDEAFVRPGRIDLYLPFNTPSIKLRRKFVEEKFEEEVLNTIDIDKLLECSDKFTFAELEEIRKLMCMDIINGRGVNMEHTLDIFEKHRKDFTERLEMGFGKLNNGDDDDGDYAIAVPNESQSWEYFAPWRNK